MLTSDGSSVPFPLVSTPASTLVPPFGQFAPGGSALSVSLYAINPTRDAARQFSSSVDSLVRDELGSYLAGKPGFAAQVAAG